ncbi:MAG: flagellar basal-body rod protein FlgG [bacterium]|nr:flagellar basal-body rod protein FlgG [bacterium]NBS52502.1 flagellar basal-body rod protein FlgG [Spartobacteria bacterium]
MLRALQTASTGMEAQQMNLNTIANNLANVNTTGFKKNKIEFQDMLYEKKRAVGAEEGSGNLVPAGVEVGNGSRVASTAKIYTQGQVTQTGEKMDVAIQGDGFFEVQRPDGTTAYTRDGGLKIASDGRVVTNDGLPLLSGFQPIPVDAQNVSISTNGQVTVQTPGGSQNFQVQLVRFNNPAGLRSVGGNLLEETPSSGTPTLGNPAEAGFGSLLQNYLETSNVNVAEEMVNMILAQRAYEVNSKAIQTSDQMMELTNNIKR